MSMPVGEFAALGTAVAWGFTSLFFAEAARRVGALRVNLLRLPMGLAFLSLALATTTAPFTLMTPSRFALLASSGVIGLTVGDLAYFGALRRLGARLSVLLMALAPIFATLTGVVLLGEVPGVRVLTGITVTLAGVAVVLAEPRGDRIAVHDRGRGILLGVVAAACQGVGLVLAKLGMAGEVQPLAATWLRLAVATVVAWAVTLIAGQLRGLKVGTGLAHAWLFLLGGAFFGPFVGVWLSLVSARLIDVGVAATIMATTPILVIPLVMAVERYRPSWRAMAGTVVAVAGVALLFSR